MPPIPLITLLGPTAVGKTALAAKLAFALNGEVISADSRQVYRRMDIGTGKDYDDYIVQGTRIPVHLIDLLEPGEEYNIYEYQRDFHRVFNDIRQRGRLPVLCGGSGLYLQTILRGIPLPAASTDENLLMEIEQSSKEQLIEMLKTYKPLHNKTDIEDRRRTIKALLVARQERHTPKPEVQSKPFDIDPVIFGITYPREMVMTRISERLKIRLANGLITEVANLLASGIPAERLIAYGLEYKFVTQFLLGKINEKELFEQLNIAIRQFAKRQMTWFRRMERQGFKINWIDGRTSEEEKLATMLSFVNLTDK